MIRPQTDHVLPPITQDPGAPTRPVESKPNQNDKIEGNALKDFLGTIDPKNVKLER